MGHQPAHQPGRAEAAASSLTPGLSSRQPRPPLAHIQRRAGNRAIGSLLQSRYRIGQPGDSLEQEADRVAGHVLSMPEPSSPPVSAPSPPAPSLIQRACAKCEEEEEEGAPIQTTAHIQTMETGSRSPAPTRSTDAKIAGLKGGGDPLPSPVKAYFEPRFGRDFGDVRIHTGSTASESTRDLDALAFTVGSDIAFAPGRFSPDTDSGKHLLAHELTHVIQQGHSGGLIQRQAASSAPGTETAAPAVGPAPGDTREHLIVEDDAEVRAGQMKKTEFLSRVQAEVCRESDDAMKGTGQNTEGCPYVEKWFAYYADKSSSYIERALRKYAPEAAGAASAAEYVPVVAARVRRSVEIWARTGDITGVPEELMGAVMGGGILGAIGSALATIGSAIGSAVSGIVGGIGRALSGIGSLFFKGRDSGADTHADPAAVKSQLGGGESLGGTVKSRMESAFGHDFSSVRIHTGPRGAEVADRLNARALAVGHDIAFGAGEYRPETIAGDALIAHELAHVVQQGPAPASPSLMPKSGGPDERLEQDADFSAAQAVASLWGGARLGLSGLSRNALPRLRSGLQLQRCSHTPSSKNPYQGKEAELFERTENCNKLSARLPSAYDPDFSPIVAVSPEQDLYEYDFTQREMELDVTACKNRLEAAGCTVLQGPAQSEWMKYTKPLICFKTQTKDGQDFNSPIEAGLVTFPARSIVYVPVERLGEKEVTEGRSDNTLNHELHHLVVNFTIMQELKGRLANRIRDRLMDIRRQAALHPENRQNLLDQTALGEMMKREAQPFYDWFAIESLRRHQPIDAAGALPPVQIPAAWKNFKRPTPTAGDKGSFTP